MDAYERLVETSTRRDNLSPNSVDVVCQFQRWAEAQPNCNYTSLRCVLYAARHTKRHLTLGQLQRAYMVL